MSAEIHVAVTARAKMVVSAAIRVVGMAGVFVWLSSMLSVWLWSVCVPFACCGIRVAVSVVCRAV